jgi:hypothetical protein
VKLADFNLFVAGFAAGVALGAVRLELYGSAVVMAAATVLNFYFYWVNR